MPTTEWDPQLYERRHAFVWQMSRDVLRLLEPAAGERILDVGCGTGQLTKQIADVGARVVGIDLSQAMIEKAKQVAHEIEFHVADARSFDFGSHFDAVFANAVLHWVVPPEAAAECMFRALKPGGRLVCEFGGMGNVAALLAAIDAAARAMSVEPPPHQNYYPTIADYAGVLQGIGFEVRSAELFDRPTPLEGSDGLFNWVKMFRAPVLDAIHPSKHDDFAALLSERAKPSLWHEQWYADYRRLRIVARRQFDRPLVQNRRLSDKTGR